VGGKQRAKCGTQVSAGSTVGTPKHIDKSTRRLNPFYLNAASCGKPPGNLGHTHDPNRKQAGTSDLEKAPCGA